jgi:ectoine hydroxylase-related dioxygenase (phytanoyl-CoA dioxygenase family)
VGNFASVRQVLASPEFNDRLTPFAQKRPIFVRGIFFDKTADSNWKVPWHQDLTIAVREKVDAPGFSGWSIKDGVQHVQPPVGLLEQMFTVRIHLDDCDPENGALEVIPGTHHHGKLSADRLQILQKTIQSRICACRSGGALLMKPLLVHSSRPAQNQPHRRVLHLEFSPDTLPFGLEWAEALDSRDSTPERPNR